MFAKSAFQNTILSVTSVSGLNHAIFESNDSFGMLGDVIFVSDHNDRLSLIVELLKKSHDFVGRFGIEVTGRFIGQNKRWVVDQ